MRAPEPSQPLGSPRRKWSLRTGLSALVVEVFQSQSYSGINRETAKLLLGCGTDFSWKGCRQSTVCVTYYRPKKDRFVDYHLLSVKKVTSE